MAGMASNTNTVKRRTGGRSARVQNAVYAAVGKLMANQRPDDITIPMVAELAEVNPTSIYRRWGDIDALLEEVAVAAFTRKEEELPDTGSLEGDLLAWADTIAEDITRPHRTRYLRAMVAARDGVLDMCPTWSSRQEQATELLGREHGHDGGVPSVEQVVDHVIAPLYHHVVFGMPVDDAYAERLVHDVLSMSRHTDTKRGKR